MAMILWLASFLLLYEQYICCGYIFYLGIEIKFYIYHHVLYLQRVRVSMSETLEHTIYKSIHLKRAILT